MKYLLMISLVLIACDDENKRGIGATCEEDGECESGLCYEKRCLEAQGDSDDDGLVNSIEGALGTNPFLADSDGDGIDDVTEIGPNVGTPIDTDGDGIIDARESIVTDCDGDQIDDQNDPDDGLDADAECPTTPCPSVCLVATQLQCPSEDRCLATCETKVASLRSECRAAFDALIACTTSASGVSCPSDGGDPYQLTVPAGACDSEYMAQNICENPD